jgi:hypothetical protein
MQQGFFVICPCHNDGDVANGNITFLWNVPQAGNISSTSKASSAITRTFRNKSPGFLMIMHMRHNALFR